MLFKYRNPFDARLKAAVCPQDVLQADFSGAADVYLCPQGFRQATAAAVQPKTHFFDRPNLLSCRVLKLQGGQHRFGPSFDC